MVLFGGPQATQDNRRSERSAAISPRTVSRCRPPGSHFLVGTQAGETMRITMSLLFCPRFLRYLVSLLAITLAHGPCQAVEFRVKSSVHVEGQQAPLHESTTYFLGKDVYDLPQDAGRQSLWLDRDAQMVTIYDPPRNAACQVSVDEAFRTVAAITVRSAELPPFVQFAARPAFKKDWQPVSETLRLSAEPMSYVVATVKPEQAEAIRAYRDFADWTARLNATCVGGLPPGARLVLNESLLAIERLPSQVELHRSAGEPSLTSRHQYTWRIDQDALADIERLRQQIASATPIDLVALRVANATPPASPPH